MLETRRKVLIVDDEVDMLASLSEAFQDEGYEVVTAVNGVDALEKLPLIGRPCVMVLDLAMPVMNGRELFSRMQLDPRFSDIPVLVSTSDPSKSPLGLQVIRKPINLDRMLEAVHKLF
ncbi:MAG: response regulator [Thermoanaerobaculia bacterium]